MLPPLYAHRLGRAYGPDSSGAALARALDGPLDGLETDCCLTADGELVLLHDPLLDAGTTLRGWAHERTAAEICAGRLRHADGTPSHERPLLLEELLRRAPRDTTLQLEVKAHADAALARRTALVLCDRLRHDPTRDRIEVISFWSGACELAAACGFRARLVLWADCPVEALAAWAEGCRAARSLRRALPPHPRLDRAARGPRPERHHGDRQPRRPARASRGARPRRGHQRPPARAPSGAPRRASRRAGCRLTGSTPGPSRAAREAPPRTFRAPSNPIPRSTAGVFENWMSEYCTTWM